MRLTGHVARMKEINKYVILFGKAEEKYLT
jgi:hypothetical protein